MALEVSVVSVSLATLCVESCIYGAMMVLFALSAYLLLVRRDPSIQVGTRKVSKLRGALMNPFVLASVLIAMSATAHWFVTCIRMFLAFVTFGGGIETLVFIANGAEPTQVANTALIVLTTVLCDSMCIYRTWVVWGYSKTVVIFPICTLIGLTVTGIGTTIQFSLFKSGSVFASNYVRWITCDIYFTLCTNVYTTTAITWRIVSIDRNVRTLRSTHLTNVLGIAIESVFIYTAWAIFSAASYQAESNLQYLALDCIPAIAGLSFMLINVRIALGWAQTSTASGAPRTVQFHSFARNHTFVSGDEYALRPLAIKIEKEVKTDLDIDFTIKDTRSETTN